MTLVGFIQTLSGNIHLHLLPGIPSAEAFCKPTKVVLRYHPNRVVNLWDFVLGVVFRMQKNVGKLRRSNGWKYSLSNYPGSTELHRDV